MRSHRVAISIAILPRSERAFIFAFVRYAALYAVADEPAQKEANRGALRCPQAGVPIPNGGDQSPKSLISDSNGIGPTWESRLSELLPPATTRDGITPIEQAAFYHGRGQNAQVQFTKEILARPSRRRVFSAIETVTHAGRARARWLALF